MGGLVLGHYTLNKGIHTILDQHVNTIRVTKDFAQSSKIYSSLCPTKKDGETPAFWCTVFNAWDESEGGYFQVSIYAPSAKGTEK